MGTIVGGDINVEAERSRNEGKLTSLVEKRTAAIPSIAYLSLAGASIVGSLGLFVIDRREAALFVGQWAPTFLVLGIYNKLVKEHESAESPILSGASH